MVFKLPAKIGGSDLLNFLGELGRVEEPQVQIDFSGLRRITPAGLSALAVTVLRWRRQERSVSFCGFEKCAITGYLQRMNLFRICGIDLPEDFRRRDSRGRFVPLRTIDHRVNDMGHEMAACLAPGGDDYEHSMSDLYDLAWYILTETTNNILQHSKGSGCVAAQVTPGDGIVRLALADNGKGILNSFRDAGLKWSERMTDAEAISKALEPRISCKGEPTNQGVGLTLISRLAKLTDGWLAIISGNGVFQAFPGRDSVMTQLPNAGTYHGTLIVLTFRQDKVRVFADILHTAKIESGLLRKDGVSVTFRS